MGEVLAKIKPSKEEEKRVSLTTKKFIKKLNSNILDAKAILGGSSAKGTWLSGNHDVDVFVLFDYKKYSRQSNQLSDLLEPVLKKSFPKKKIEKIHGSRDYFQLVYEYLNFEVIPILKINKASEAINITDISPLHSTWVSKYKVKDEIRLAKQFFKSNNLYGAESYISGFSGYVLEILVIFYGSFNKLLEASQKWINKEIIDPSNYYKKKTALFHINSSKLQSPLIVVDPVDKSRNAAAALSKEKYLLFRKIAREYLKNPNKKFFEKEKITLAKLKNEAKDQNLVVITIISKKGKEDVIGSKLLKAFNYIKKELKPFKITKSGWDWDQKNKATFYYFLSKRELSKFEVRQGPPLSFKEHLKEFKEKNKNCFEEKGRIFTKVKNKHPRLKDYVDNLVKDNYVKERVNNIKEVIIS